MEQVMKNLFLELIDNIDGGIPGDVMKLLDSFEKSNKFEYLDLNNIDINLLTILSILNKISEINDNIFPRKLERFTIIKRKVKEENIIMIAVEKVTLISIFDKIIKVYDYEPKLFMLI